MDIEVDASLVLSKTITLLSVSGRHVDCYLQVYESENPYVLIFLFEFESDEQINHSQSRNKKQLDQLQMHVHKDDLAYELRLWLEGKHLRNPAVLVPMRIEESINKFVNYGKTPTQEDLILWLISRSEFYYGINSEIIFGGKNVEQHISVRNNNNNKQNEMKQNPIVSNKYSKTVEAALDSRKSTRKEEQKSYTNPTIDASFNVSKMFIQSNIIPSYSISLETKQISNPEYATFRLTKKILGKSKTLESQPHVKLKGREGAKTINKIKWSSNAKLCTDVEKARKHIEDAMDTRRRLIEVTKTRNEQKADKYRKIRNEVMEDTSANKFRVMAMEELNTYRKIQMDIDEDIARQKFRAVKESRTVFWTMAPNGYANRRGKSQRGPVIGAGPLPYSATTTLRDPRLDDTFQKYYWDVAGRRHIKSHDGSGQNEESLIEQAMEAIRKAAANAALYKLDLKKVFKEIDTSGDGFITEDEMMQGFQHMGVELDIESMHAIFRYFDPNGSGSVHYGEFIWAFFNRRKLMNEWKQQTDKLSSDQVASKFHAADINGDGQLNEKEFKKLLKNLGLDWDEVEIRTVMDRFDLDGDGSIDMKEFKIFIESEQQNMISSSASQSHDGMGLRSSSNNSDRFGSDRQWNSNTSTAPKTRPQSAPRLQSASRGSKPNEHALTYQQSKASEKSYVKSERLNRTVQNDQPGKSNTSNFTKSESNVDLIWISDILRKQALVESKLGSKYYPNVK